MTSPSPSREVEEILNRLYRTGGYKLDGTSVANGYIEPLSLEEATQSINQLISNQISATLDLVEGALPKLKDMSKFEGIGEDGGIDVKVDEKNEAITGDNLAHLATFASDSGFNDATQQALEAIKKIRRKL